MSEPDHLRKYEFCNAVKCEDCGKTCKRIITWTLINHNNNALPSWWKGSCSCGKVRHPITFEWKQPNKKTFNQDVNKAFRALNPQKPGPKGKRLTKS